MSNWINFLKYNNTVPIVLGVIFLGGSAALAASPDVRNQIINSEQVAVSLDNSYLLAANLDLLDFKLRIDSITQDKDIYQVTYSYQTIAIEDAAWKLVQKQNLLKVSREKLEKSNEQDLGVYASREIADTLGGELYYLKRAQNMERQNGPSEKVVATEYSGLVGRYFDPKMETFQGYAAVIRSLPETQHTATSTQSVEEMRESIRIMLTAREKVEAENKLREEEEAKRLAEEKARQVEQQPAEIPDIVNDPRLNPDYYPTPAIPPQEPPVSTSTPPTYPTPAEATSTPPIVPSEPEATSTPVTTPPEPDQEPNPETTASSTSP